MKIEEVKNLQIEFVELEAKERKYKDLLGQAYTEVNEHDRIKIKFEIPILEQRIEEIRKKLENITIE